MKCDRLLSKVLLLQSVSCIRKCNSNYKMRRNKGERQLAKWDIDYFDYKENVVSVQALILKKDVLLLPVLCTRMLRFSRIL